MNDYLDYARSIAIEQNDINDIENKFNTLVTLEAMQTKLATAYKERGINESAANALNVSVEHMLSVMKLPKQTVFVMENYGNKSSRKQSLKIAMEGIASTISKIIQAIISWIKKAYDFVERNLEELFKGAATKVKKVKAIEAALVALKEPMSSKSSVGITNKRVISFFAKHGTSKTLSPEDIIKEYTDYTAFLGNSFSNQKLVEISEEMKQIIIKAKANLAADDILVLIDKTLTQIKQSNFKDFKKSTTDPANQQTLSYPLPFGNRVIDAVFKQSETGKLISLDVSASTAPTATVGGTDVDKIPALTPLQIQALCKVVESAMLNGFYKDYSKTKAELTKMKSVIINGCTDIGRNESGNNDAQQASIKTALAFLKGLASSTMTMTSTLKKYDAMVADTVLEYCTVSLKQYN